MSENKDQLEGTLEGGGATSPEAGVVSEGITTETLRRASVRIDAKVSDPEGINKFLSKEDFIKRRKAQNEKKAKIQKRIDELDLEDSKTEDTASVKKAKALAKKDKARKDVRDKANKDFRDKKQGKKSAKKTTKKKTTKVGAIKKVVRR